MLVWLAEYCQTFFTIFNVFHYVTFRVILAAITALLVTLMVGPHMISRLAQAQIGQIVRSNGPKTHLVKAGTPTMGGVLILFSITLSVLLWSRLNNAYIWLTLLGMLGFGLLERDRRI